MTTMDTQIRELDSELDAENRRSPDSRKNLKKSDCKIKGLAHQQDDDRNNHMYYMRMQAFVDQLHGKIKSYKKQIEEAVEIAAFNLAKYRLQTMLLVLRNVPMLMNKLLPKPRPGPVLRLLHL